MAALTDGTTVIPQSSSALPSSTSVPNVGANLPPVVATTPTTQVKTSPPAAFSSEAGKTALSDAKSTADKLSAPQSQPNIDASYSPVYDDKNNITGYNSTDAYGKTTFKPNPVVKTDTTPTSTTTLINPTTGQEYTLNNATAEQIASFKSSGWDIAEGTGTGVGLIPNNTDPQLAKDQAKVDQAKTDRDAAIAKLTTFNVSNDPALTALLGSITTDWNSRIKDMEMANKSRVADTTTLGIRLGDRYTGGTGGMFGGIISEEENQGAQRISTLESQKQQALAQATKAYSDQQWDRYAKLVDVAENAYKDQVDELQKLQTATITRSKNIQDAVAKEREDYYTQVGKPINDVAMSAAKNGLTDSKILAAIQAAPDLGTAISLAGDSLSTGTGIVGEYIFYKNQAKAAGQTPVDFNTYQNMDANRKANAGGGVGGSSLPPDQASAASFLSGRIPTQIAAFNKLSSIDQGNVMQLINGDALLSDLISARGTQGSNAKQQLLNQARAVDPTFSENENKIRYQFNKDWQSATTKVGITRNAINTGLGHLADFKTNADALNPGTIKKLNSIANILTNQTGDPAVLKVRTDINALAGELASIYKGGVPSEPEIHSWAETLAADFSKSQFKGVSDEVAKLISSKLTALRYQYKSTMGREYDQTLIDPDKKDALIAAGVDPSVFPDEGTAQPSTAQLLIQKGKDDPLNLGQPPGSTSTSNPLGI